MRKLLPLLLILPFLGQELRAQCNTAFTSSVNQATAQFQATGSTGPNFYHSWRFGDGSQGWGASTSHTYSLPGTYTVTHIVVDSFNTCGDSVQQTVVISFATSCQASFISARDTVHPNQYHFSSTSQVSGGSVQSYLWTIDSVAVSGASSFAYTLSPGVHSVCLSISTTAGCTSSVCQNITVDSLPSSCNWQASFTSTGSASNPRRISFFPTPSSNTLRYHWSFGDGTSSIQRTPVHVYSQAGTYSVRLAILDSSNGCHDTTRHNVQVFGAPRDSCTASYTYITDSLHPNQLSFTAISNQTIVSQTWYIHSFDSSHHAVLTTMNPTHIFPDTGSYSVCLRIVTNTGCIKSYCSVITIHSTGQRIANNLIPSYPNPASGSTVSLRLVLEQDSRVRITIYNTSGNAVYTNERNAGQGMNTITIPVSGLQRGQYFIDIQYGRERKRSIFQKL